MPSCDASGEKRFMDKYKKETQENVEKENIEIRIAPPQKKYLIILQLRKLLMEWM